MQMQASVPMFECLFIMSESAFNKKNPYFNNVETSRNFVDSWIEHLSRGTSPDQPPGGRTEAQLLCWGQLGGAGGGAAAIILSGDLTISNIHTGHWPPPGSPADTGPRWEAVYY